MLYDKNVDLDDEPRVPKAVRFHLHRILRGARAIIVSEVTSSASKKVNGLKLSTKTAPNSMPNDSVDDIAEGVCRIMHNEWIAANLNAKEDEIVSIHFRISAKVDHPGRGQAKNPSFDWTYDPEGLASEIDEVAEIEKTSMMQLLEANERSRETDRLHIENMQDRFLNLAEHLGAPLSQMGEILQYAGGLSLQGSQMMVNAMQMTFSIETQKELEAQRTRRSEMMWSRVGGWLDIGIPKALEQLGEHLGKFVGKKKTEAAGRARATGQAAQAAQSDDDGNWRPPQPGGAPRPEAAQGSAPTEATEDDDGLTADERANMIATLCRMFGEDIKPPQHRDLDELMTKREKQIFYDLCCVTTNDDAIVAWDALAAKLSSDKLVRLNKLLSDDQRQIFLKVRSMITKLKAQAAAQDEAVFEATEDDDDA